MAASWSAARRSSRRSRAPPTITASCAPSAPKATPIAVDPKALLRILHSGANTLISLKMGAGVESKVLVKEYQLDPITHALLNADFYQVAMDRAIQVTIPVSIKGEPKGVKQQGGVLEFVRREIEVEFEEFAVDSRSTPQGISRGHSSDQDSEGGVDRRTARRGAESVAQWRRKRRRCQRSTVSGATMTRAWLQADHTLDRQTQRSRSLR